MRPLTPAKSEFCTVPGVRGAETGVGPRASSNAAPANAATGISDASRCVYCLHTVPSQQADGD